PRTAKSPVPCPLSPEVVWLEDIDAGLICGPETCPNVVPSRLSRPTPERSQGSGHQFRGSSPYQKTVTRPDPLMKVSRPRFFTLSQSAGRGRGEGRSWIPQSRPTASSSAFDLLLQ